MTSRNNLFGDLKIVMESTLLGTVIVAFVMITAANIYGFLVDKIATLLTYIYYYVRANCFIIDGIEDSYHPDHRLN